MANGKDRRITVRDLVENGSLQGISVIAGEGGLDNLVSSVNVMEVPDIDAWIEPNQLLLTTAYAIKDNETAKAELIPKLAQKGLAGIIIKSRYLSSIPASMIDAANKNNFPLMEMADSLSHQLVINEVYKLLSNNKNLTDTPDVLQRQLINSIVQGNGFQQLCDIVQNHFGGSVCIFDNYFQALAYSPCEQDRNIPAEALAEAAKEYGLFSPYKISISETQQPQLPFSIITIPSLVRNSCQGFILFKMQTNEIPEHFYENIEQINHVVALVFLNQVSQREVEDRYKNAFIMDWLMGRFASETVMYQRASAVNWYIDCNFSLLLISDMYFADRNKKGDYNNLTTDAKKNEYVKATLHLTLSYFSSIKQYYIGNLGDDVILFLRLPDDIDNHAANSVLKQTAGRIVELLQSRFGILCRISVGHFYKDPFQLSRSYREASKTLSIVKTFSLENKVMLYDELGIFRLIFHLDEEEKLRLIDEFFVPLYQHDTKHGTQLLNTLYAYFRYDRNMRVVAEKTFLHYNTVRYRLNSASKIVNVDFEDYSRSLLLHMAIILGTYLQKNNELFASFASGELSEQQR